METRFEEIIHDLSKTIDVDLLIEEDNVISVLVDERLPLQLEADLDTNRLLIFTSIANISAGKFRENVLINALKENDKFEFDFTFAYLEEDNSLVMFTYLNFEEITVNTLNQILASFVDISLLWKDAIDTGKDAPTEIISSNKEKPFNLK